MRSPDTDPVAETIQIDAYVRLEEAGRLRVALELSDLTHALAISGTKMRNPNLSDEEARRVLAIDLYGSFGSTLHGR